MLDRARLIQERVKGLSRQGFDEDVNLRFALAHLLQTIGEAARHVSSSFQQAHPNIPWKAIIGMRHRVVHDYMNLDEDVVWSTATKNMPPLIAELKKIVPEEEGS
jgi:uncharacterized protein with HEPN domain